MARDFHFIFCFRNWSPTIFSLALYRYLSAHCFPTFSLATNMTEFAFIWGLRMAFLPTFSKCWSKCIIKKRMRSELTQKPPAAYLSTDCIFYIYFSMKWNGMFERPHHRAQCESMIWRIVQIRWNFYSAAHMNMILESDKYILLASITPKSTPKIKIKITLNEKCRRGSERNGCSFVLLLLGSLFLACFTHSHKQPRHLALRPPYALSFRLVFSL